MRKAIQEGFMLKRTSQELADRKARLHSQTTFTGRELEMTPDFVNMKMSN